MLTVAGSIGRCQVRPGTADVRQEQYCIVGAHICGPGEPCCLNVCVTCPRTGAAFSRREVHLSLEETLVGGRTRAVPLQFGFTSPGFLFHRLLSA